VGDADSNARTFTSTPISIETQTQTHTEIETYILSILIQLFVAWETQQFNWNYMGILYLYSV